MTYDTINNDVTMGGGEESVLGRIDKYELVRELGEGGFGTVYLARDMVADVDVAVKGLPPEVKHNAVELESIRRNFALVKRLRHPNIVAVTDLHQAVAVRYATKEVESKLRVYERDTMVVMDYAPGVTLAQWRRRFPDGKVPPDKAIAVARQVASALDYAHGQKVLHRDVKPANVMVDAAEDGRLVARVLDFGLAAEIRSSMGRVSREIRDTSGTRPYMAPEQWKGDRQGPATDQYALAAMFYELVVGEVPFASVFDCGDTAVMRLAVTTDAPKMPSSLPKNMRKALAVALSKKPEDRFASCGDFVAALEGRAAAQEVGPQAGCVLAVLALLAALGGGAWWWQTGRIPASCVQPVPSVVQPPASPTPSVVPIAPGDAVRQEAEYKAKEEADRIDAERKAKEEKAAAERKAREIAERKAKEEAERKAKEEAARIDAERKAKEEKAAAERKAREIAERKTKEESERRAKEEAARIEAERKAKEEEIGRNGAPKPPPVSPPAAPPTLTVRAELNGRETIGARMQTMSGHVSLPYDWPGRLTRERSYGPYLVHYSDGYNNYYGSFKIEDVNWNGHTNITVRLGVTWPEDIRRPAQGIRSWAF